MVIIFFFKHFLKYKLIEFFILKFLMKKKNINSILKIMNSYLNIIS